MRVIKFTQITQLKIDHNPFAKGFRDTGAGKSAKKWVFFSYVFVSALECVRVICRVWKEN